MGLILIKFNMVAWAGLLLLIVTGPQTAYLGN